MLQWRLLALGNGATLVRADANHGVAKQIEAWFRVYRDFDENRGSTAAVPSCTSSGPSRRVHRR